MLNDCEHHLTNELGTCSFRFYGLFLIPKKCKAAFSSPSSLFMWDHGALLSLQDNMGRKTWEGRVVQLNCPSGGQEWG